MSTLIASAGRPRLAALPLLAGVLILAAAAAARAQTAGASATTVTFSTPGAHVWTVPTGVTHATFDVFGASGGDVDADVNGTVQVVSQGGAGGEAKGRFSVVAGERFEIVVGGRGALSIEGSSTSAAGGFNGGGPAIVGGGGGGGGASDIRIGGRGNVCAAQNACSLPDRIVAAGGGGGGAAASGVDGGVGGGVTGGPAACTSHGVGGAQECGGTAQPLQCVDSPGTFGHGGAACSAAGGGGGGGWYGGAGAYGVAGGGSGYVARVSLGGSFPGGTNVGDGKVVISAS